jgi:signal transduction histidine kinase
MITKTQLKQEIDQLDDSYLELAYQLLHQLQRPEPMQCSRPIDYAVQDIDDEPVFVEIKDAAGYVKNLRAEWHDH